MIDNDIVSRTGPAAHKPCNKEIEVAVNALASAFLWAYTPQGWDYWQEVSMNLESLKEAAVSHEGDGT